MTQVVQCYNENDYTEITVSYQKNWTIQDLKEEIKKQQGIDVEDQIIMADEHEYLCDSTKIGGLQWQELKHNVGIDQKFWHMNYDYKDTEAYVSGLVRFLIYFGVETTNDQGGLRAILEMHVGLSSTEEYGPSQ